MFNATATEHGGVFRRFRWHPNYFYSEVLSESLQVLDHAGSIVRENAAQTYFRVSKHAAGAYGKATYERLTADDQHAVDDLARSIIENRTARNGTGTRD
jgi:hypothetical protein